VPTLKEVERLADDLCEQEPTYLNMNIISRDQVFELLKKLYKSEYKCDPPVETKILEPAAAPAKSAAATAKAKEAEKSDFSDNYDDDFSDHGAKKAKDANKKLAGKKDSDDDWGMDGMDDEWGEPNADFRKDGPSKDANKEASDKQRQDMFFGGDKDELDGLPNIGDGSGEKNEDKFN